MSKKEPWQTFWVVAKQLATLEQIYMSKGQIILFRGLEWGVVCLCSSEIARDMAKNVNIPILPFFCFFDVLVKKIYYIFTKTENLRNW